VLKNISSRLLGLFFIAALAFQATWYALLWVSYVCDPQVLAEADFRAFYAAGRIARQEGFRWVYDLALEHRLQAEIADAPLADKAVLIYIHPPLLLPVLWLLAHLDYPTAYIGYGLVQIAIVLAIPFLFNRRKVFGWFCVGGAALGLLSLAMVGLTGVRDYLRILAVSAGGQGYGLSQSAMFNFTGLAFRLFPHVDPGMIRWLAWGLFAAGIVGLSVLWKVSPAIRLRHLGLAVLTSLFVAPHLHYHDLALLLLPILGFAIILVEAGVLRPERSMYLPVAFSLLLLLGDISPARFVIPYLVMAFLVVGLWFPVKLLFMSRKMA